MVLDSQDLPRLARYLEDLPQQLASHPAALTKADFSLILRQKLGPCLDEARLSAGLRFSLTAPWKVGDWIPTTAYVALCALARDKLWQSDEAYHEGMVDVATEMYKGPLYRALFIMFGPNLVAMGAGRRWHTLHQGTELVVKKQRKESIDLELTFPAKLFCESGVQSLGAAFCAVAQGSRAKDARFEPRSMGDTAAEMTISWTS